MSKPTLPGKWVEGLHGDTPCTVAARRLLRLRLRAVERLAPLAVEHAEEDVEYIHQLRVATRRAAAVLRHFAPFCERRAFRRLRARLRALRAAAAIARRDDVHAETFARDAAESDEALRSGYSALLQDANDSRAAAQNAVRTAARRRGRRRMAKLRRRLLRALASPTPCDPAVLLDVTAVASLPPYSLAELAAQALPAELDAVRRVSTAALRDFETLHGLRLAGKRLRYGLEIFAGCFPVEFRDELYPRIEELQEHLGAINDRYEIVLRIDGFMQRLDELVRRRAANDGPELPGAAVLARIRARYAADRDRLHATFLEWWDGPATANLFERLEAMIHAWCPPRRVFRRPVRPAAPAAHNGNGAEPAVAGVPHRHRVAAIDVGTNSVRLVVAESDSSVPFRVIEDVKETTRLGAGLYRTGRLDDAAMQRSIAALQRMRRIAEGFHVDRIRAVGTSAVREADNGAEFVELARRQADVAVEPIDADQEARLAFVSVANAFDLDDRRIAVADIGGGSTELIVSAGGVLDAVHKLPLGAVRLTEMHARRGGRGKYHFGEMRRGVDKVIADVIGRPPYPLELMIGTGGTFTSLARAALLRSGGHVGGRFPFAVRGVELPCEDIREILGWLRRMPLDERRRVPGISSQRAEIIVAGICIVERLMRRLSIDRLRVHDGGIRDGLLAEMMDELGAAPVRPPHFSRSSLAAVRAFARRSRYEKAHSEHVARLALRLFDQLEAAVPDAAGAWAGRESRDLLHAAAVLHDVGMLIGWEDHEQHSYDMILHADLALYSRRELEVIANIARYHRGRGPRPRDPNLRKLNDDDQRLVGQLAGILRIADGLDRLHTQNVSDLVVSVEPKCVRIDVAAASSPDVNLRFARKKADVFDAAFHTRVDIGWSPALAVSGSESIES